MRTGLHRRLAIALTVVAAVSTTSTGCAPGSKVADLRFDTYAAAAQSGIRSEIPAVVAKDATDIRFINDQGSRKPSTLLRWDSPTARPSTSGYCKEGTLPHAPKMTASWWPTSLPDTGRVCDVWATFDENDHHYAWDTRS